MNDSAISWDPYDRRLHRDPYDTWRRLRDEAPVYHNERLEFYALSRFDDVLEASLDTETFSSSHGITLDHIGDEPLPPPQPMIMMDPPDHTRMRKLVSRTFTPRRMAQLEEHLRTLCAGYLDPLMGTDGFDYVQEFTMKLPVMMISSMLGFPEEDHDQLRIWSDLQLHREEGHTELSPAGAEAMGKLFGYYQEQVNLRRHSPRDDMLTDIMTYELVEDDGTSRRLTDGEILAYVSLINIAGNETVARLLGWAGIVLAEHPDVRANLVEHPESTPMAIEELLRYEAPSPVQGRYTLRDAEYHRVTIPAGSRVLLLTGAAGRDEREYDEPDRYVLDRGNRRHLSLGHGAHFCLGASLARMESRIGLEETLRRFPTWEIDRDEIEYVHTNSVRGPAKLPIHF